MTWIHRHWVGMMVAVVLLAACGAAGDDNTPPAPHGTVRGQHTGSSWTGQALVSDALLAEGRVRKAAMVREEERLEPQAVYGEAKRRDPVDGRMLVVGADSDGGEAVVPKMSTPGFRPFELNGRPAVVGRDRVWTWVTWRLKECIDPCVGYVVGRNLREAEVLAAARGAVVEHGVASVEDASLPRGMTRLFTGGLHLSRFRIAAKQEVTWSPGSGEVRLSVAEDEGLALLLRFWVDGPPVDVRGHAGSAGHLALFDVGGSVDVRSWAESGHTILVIGHGVSGQTLDDFVGALRGAQPGEWERVRTRVLDVPPEAAVETCAGRDQPVVAIGRREERYRWAIGFWSPRPHEASFCHVILTPEDWVGHEPNGGLLYVVPGALTIASLGLVGGDPGGRFVMGVAPPGTARVLAEPESGGSIDALMTDEGPEPGYRYFGLFLEGDERNTRAPTIIALDPSGVELGRAQR